MSSHSTGPAGITAERTAITSGAGVGAGVDYGRAALAAAMIGLGLRGLVYGDFAGVWQPVPEQLPGYDFLAYACAALELLCGVGLLVKRTVAVASTVLLVLLFLWLLLLRLPTVVAEPLVEVSWLGFGENAVITAGGWVVFALNAPGWATRRLEFAVGRPGLRGARVLMALGLPMIGLSHFVYADATAGFVPDWLPWPYFWGYLTGAGDIAAGLAMLFGVWPRPAAVLVSAMLGIITLLVWLPGVVTAPGNGSWTPFLVSSTIACGAWAVAASYRRTA